ncbi:uncharacterized protein EHS24_008463 [Apiotrichum porosum]|uniref:Vacuolar protein sorting-associated protein 51 homolog n=1 Tax=Apiotrichum porosum TaxID=105984 RepID=A0A427XQ96_9TREE|nr:uncharacterized protein EHS24_008463 [Apiotrichum porosum]RSH81029.1 hypothetical protein EHS24_008463 [Apiotrichum porosum]
MAAPTPVSALPPRASSVPDRVLSPTRKETPEARRARREQLRDFYGLKNANTAGGPSSTPGSPEPASSGLGGMASPALSVDAVMAAHAASTTPSPTPGKKSRRGTPGGAAAARDLSSPHFVPAEYYEDVIGKASLAELLQTTSTLATDVGRLQSSRHTLVYNHHHQLFSAGDTIAALNTRTPQLLSIVTSLQERFSDMSQLADSVALPELPESAKDGNNSEQRAGATAAQGLERVRLMVLAEEPVEKVQEVWKAVEKRLEGAQVEGVADVIREGRELAGL